MPTAPRRVSRLKIIYSYNKSGFEADYWQGEIAAASDESCQFIPFNHGPYVASANCVRAQLIDNLYYARDPGLMRLYGDVDRLVAETNADAIIADNYFPYHPEFLRRLPIYKVLRTTDGPMTAYDRDFAYLHAYDHVLYHSPAYSRDLGMREKLLYCGAKRVDFWPLAVFDRCCSPLLDESQVFASERDIDVVFVGSVFLDKMPILDAVKKAFGKRFVMYGLITWKRNLYWNAKFGLPGWIRPLPFEQFVPLYRRAKIGINVHNRGKFTIGGYRMFELPANGVMQICDGSEYLDRFYDVGSEVVGYEGADELIEKIDHFLVHPEEREEIARNGYRRVMRDHRIGKRLHQAGKLIGDGIRAVGSSRVLVTEGG